MTSESVVVILRELRKYVHRRRRQNTPRHGSRSRDDDETEEPPQRPEELGEEEWPENVREERRDTLPEAFEGEPEQAGGETENMQKEKNLRASWKDRSLSIVAQTTQSRANS